MPMLEIHVTADNIDELKTEIAKLAAVFGVTTGPVTIEKTESGAVTGTTTGKRGRKPKDPAAAANALTEEEPVAEEETDGFDPFGEAEEETGEVDLEKLKSDTIARLQKLAGSKTGLDTLKSLTDKYSNGEKKFKFASLDASVFTKIAKDLDTLRVA